MFPNVVVIGAGQAGLSAAYHLRRSGLAGALEIPGDTSSATFVALDGEKGPGGAWRHRWRTLRMATVNKVHDLPGRRLPDVDPCAPSREAVPEYYADYERDFDLPILRPVHVRRVSRQDDDSQGRLLVTTDSGEWSTRAIINGTGTWTKPFWPLYPGHRTFQGRQLHTADYVSAGEGWRGRRRHRARRPRPRLGSLEGRSTTTSTANSVCLRRFSPRFRARWLPRSSAPLPRCGGEIEVEWPVEVDRA